MHKAACALAPILAFSTLHGEEAISYEDTIARLPTEITLVLAKHHLPDASGAMGRNRKAYFHVRFQMGVHHLASHAIATQDPAVLDQFVKALEYAFARQNSDGTFALAIPEKLASQGSPGPTDLASGIAFFLSSAGTGLYALETSTWVRESADLQGLRERCEAIKSQLPATLERLRGEEERLKTADRLAANRLLFNAAALISCGKLVDSPESIEMGERFLDLATAQIHEDGYFIEGGGTDTSYNGVAAAIAIRLALLTDSASLRTSALRAIDWQCRRIAESGEISMEGNTRVRPGGESFLNREKDVDVGNTLEALALAATVEDDDSKLTLAGKVYEFYGKR